MREIGFGEYMGTDLVAAGLLEDLVEKVVVVDNPLALSLASSLIVVGSVVLTVIIVFFFLRNRSR
jgi:hypothetical protein